MLHLSELHEKIQQVANRRNSPKDNSKIGIFRVMG